MDLQHIRCFYSLHPPSPGGWGGKEGGGGLSPLTKQVEQNNTRTDNVAFIVMLTDYINMLAERLGGLALKVFKVCVCVFKLTAACWTA